MHGDLPTQSIAAIATLVAALIAGALSFVNLTLTKELKTSEFRQAWIDSLREDLAKFFGSARAFARAVEVLHIFEPTYKDNAALLITDEKISELRYQAAETLCRIKLRLNPDEAEHKAYQCADAFIVYTDRATNEPIYGIEYTVDASGLVEGIMAGDLKTALPPC